MVTPKVLRLCSFIHSESSMKQIVFSLEIENGQYLKLNNQRKVWSNGKRQRSGLPLNKSDSISSS